MRGLPGTAMPAFGTTLSRADLGAVIGYVASLNGIANASINLGPGGPGAAGPAEKPLSGEAERGRALFFDAVRGFGRCSTCHEVNGIGISVTTAIANIPADPAALRALATPDVRTATVDGESMPALIVSQGKTRALFYDLTSTPPVLRTVDPGVFARGGQAAVAARRRRISNAKSRPMPCFIAIEIQSSAKGSMRRA